MDFKKMVMKAGKYTRNAALITFTGLGVIWGAKKVAERTPVDLDEDILDELTGD